MDNSSAQFFEEVENFDLTQYAFVSIVMYRYIKKKIMMTLDEKSIFFCMGKLFFYCVRKKKNKKLFST